MRSAPTSSLPAGRSCLGRCRRDHGQLPCRPLRARHRRQPYPPRHPHPQPRTPPACLQPAPQSRAAQPHRQTYRPRRAKKRRVSGKMDQEAEGPCKALPIVLSNCPQGWSNSQEGRLPRREPSPAPRQKAASCAGRSASWGGRSTLTGDGRGPARVGGSLSRASWVRNDACLSGRRASSTHRPALVVRPDRVQ